MQLRFVISFLKKTSESRKLIIKKFAILKLFVIAAPNEFFSSVILIANFFEFLVSFIVFHIGCSVVLGLINFDMKLSSFRLTFVLSLRI